jgi:hypothetical protein
VVGLVAVERAVVGDIATRRPKSGAELEPILGSRAQKIIRQASSRRRAQQALFTAS